MLDAKHLPLVLPEVDEYLPTETGEPPLGRAKNWAWDTVNEKIVSNDLIDHQTIFPLELNTMPGWAGSSWYFLRYMDATNSDEFVSKDALNYWKEVDLYIGGSEHATGHLLYARFWQKFLYDREWVPTKEFAKTHQSRNDFGNERLCVSNQRKQSIRFFQPKRSIRNHANFRGYQFAQRRDRRIGFGEIQSLAR